MKDLTTDENIASGSAGGFNYNKLQAVLCISCSAALSTAAIYWLFSTLF